MTAKHERFIAEYLIDLNATAAAKRAGYSVKSAKHYGKRLLGLPAIAKAIAERHQEQIEKAELTATRTLEELRRVAFSNIRTFLDRKGNIRPLHTLTPAESACVSSVEVILKNAEAGDGKIDRVLKIRMWDKTRAIEMAMKHFALLVEKLDVTVRTDEIMKRLLAGRERAAKQAERVN